MKAVIIFEGKPKEAAIIEAALRHYAKAIVCAYVGAVSVAPKPLLVDGNPLVDLRIAKTLVREMG